MKEITVNINQEARIELTPAGKALCQQEGRLNQWNFNYITNTLRGPIWELMQIFGPHTYMGGPHHIVGNNLIIED